MPAGLAMWLGSFQANGGLSALDGLRGLAGWEMSGPRGDTWTVKATEKHAE